MYVDTYIDKLCRMSLSLDCHLSTINQAENTLDSNIGGNWTKVYSGYFNHRESKFDDNIGQLNRKLILINNIIHIGKENGSLELDYILGLNNLNGDIIEKYDTLQSNLVSKSNFTTLKLRKRSKLRKLVDKQFNENQVAYFI